MTNQPPLNTSKPFAVKPIASEQMASYRAAPQQLSETNRTALKYLGDLNGAFQSYVADYKRDIKIIMAQQHEMAGQMGQVIDYQQGEILKRKAGEVTEWTDTKQRKKRSKEKKEIVPVELPAEEEPEKKTTDVKRSVNKVLDLTGASDSGDLDLVDLLYSQNLYLVGGDEKGDDNGAAKKKRRSKKKSLSK
jgi:hypothetical protein